MCIDLIPQKCFDHTKVKSKTFVSKFKTKTSYRIENNSGKTISQIEFDNCKGPTETICDSLFIIENGVERYIFVELKDSDVSKALRQIEETRKKFKDCLKGKIVDYRIVTTKTKAPDLKTSEYKKIKKELNENGGDLITRSQTYTEKI